MDNNFGGYFDYTPSINPLDNKELGEKFKVKGIIVSERYFDIVKNFGIYAIEDTDGNRMVVKGTFSTSLIIGQTYEFIGTVTEFRFERQLSLKEYYPCRPVNKRGVISYLQTLYGLKSKAELIYNTFGEDSIDILINDPMLVANSIKGIGKKSVVKWQEQLKELAEDQYIYMKLLGFGLTEKAITNILKKYGASIVEKIEENPYILMKEVKGYGFNKCDKIALDNGIEPNSEVRVKAGIIHTLEEFSKSGHCYCPYDLIVNEVKQKIQLVLNYKDMNSFYNINKDKNEAVLKIYNRNYTINISELKDCIYKYINCENINERKYHRYVLSPISNTLIENKISELIDSNELILEKNKLYIPKLYWAEVDLANKISKLAIYFPIYSRSKVEAIVDEVCREKGYILENKQREACIEFNMYNYGLFILNGSAGTGKTFTLNLILEVSKRLNQKSNEVLVVAPTGKASKVASKSTGMECVTIHRALGFTPGVGFNKNEEEPFEGNEFVCDEGSMIDVELGKAFLKAIRNKSKLIIMGDIQQLPSVGPGNVLKDLLECGVVRVITLNVPKRQDVLSGINVNANRIIDGKMIQTEMKTKDFYVLQRETIDSVKDGVIKSIKRVLTFEGYTLEDIQVLIPQRTGALGVNMFNYLLQKQFNPNGINGAKVLKTKFEAKEYENTKPKEFELYICKGDKVMHIQNNYEMKLYKESIYGLTPIEKTGITNGECGIVTDIKMSKDNKSYSITVKYDDFSCIYDSIEELELCYATTIHKSQGSAWRAVILPVVNQHMQMLSNNLLYTGVTRARDFCAVIGSPKAINVAINKKTVMDRYTALSNRIIEYSKVS